MKLQEATNIAIGIWRTMKELCEPGHCKIAGSIRREKPEVKDIEIVALPKVIEIKDMFDKVTGHTRTKEWTEFVYSLGKAEKGSPHGKMMQIQLREHDIKLDLFMPDDFDYWRQFAIRTGSADWTARFIAGGWKNQGWCGSDVGLRLMKQCQGTMGPDKKMKWKCTAPPSQQTLPPAWKSEKEFFEWIKLPFIEPRNRNI